MLMVLDTVQQKEPRNMENSTTILFGLPGVAVRGVERVEGVRVVDVVTDDPGAAACPECGVFSGAVRQCRKTRPKDLGYGEELT
jgi:transposase